MFVFVVRTIYIKIENVSILLCNSRYFLIYSIDYILAGDYYIPVSLVDTVTNACDAFS